MKTLPLAEAKAKLSRLDTVLSVSSDVFRRPVIMIVEDSRHRVRYLPIGGPSR